MSRGGYRLGAGRPKGSPNKVPAGERAGYGPDLSPLDYMPAVMRDGDADPRRRDEMALAAARCVHSRPAPPGGWRATRATAEGTPAGSACDELLDPSLDASGRVLDQMSA